MFNMNRTKKNQPRQSAVIQISRSEILFAASVPQEGGPTRLRWRQVVWLKDAAGLHTTEGRQELVQAIKTLAEEEKLAGAKVHFSLSGDFCVTRVVCGANEVVTKELQNLEKRTALYLSLGIGPKSFTHTQRAIDAKRSQAWMTVASANSMEAITTAAQQAGFQVASVEHSLVSLSRTVGALGKDKENPAIIIEMNQRGVDLGISYQGSLLLDYRPGGEGAKDHLAETIMLHWDRIQRHCSRHFQFASGKINRVLLAGEPEEVAKICREFDALGQLTAELLDPREIKPDWVWEDATGVDSRLAAAVGTLSSADSNQETSESPDLMAPLRMLQRGPLLPTLIKTCWPIAAALALSLLIMTAGWLKQYQCGSLTAEVNAAKEADGELSKVQMELAAALAKIRYFTKIESRLRRPMWHEFLSSIGGCLPEGLWLESLKVDRDGSVNIVGPSYSEKNIYDFIAQLKSLPQLANVALEGTKETRVRDGSATVFDVKCNLAGGNASSKGS